MKSRQTRIRRALWLVTGVLLGVIQLPLSGQQPKPSKDGVTVLASKPESLAKAKTYVWTRSQPANLKSVDDQIVAAVDRELAARGLTKLASGAADVVVTYGSLTRTQIGAAKRSPTGGLGQYEVGTLLVDIRDYAATRDLANLDSVFKARMDTPIDTEPAKLEAAINATVATLFSHYPSGPKR